MDDLERLFRHLVFLLAARAPDRLHGAFQLTELYDEILPYRQHRASLGFDTNQDYEMAMLRLVAGHGGYATVEPPETQAALEAEADAINPDTGAFRSHPGAQLRLNPTAIRSVLEAQRAYAPTPPRNSPAHRSPPPAAGAPEPRAAQEQLCIYCGRSLPPHRAARYCPFCGGNQEGLQCSVCGADLEEGWTFCVACGQKRTRA